MAGVVGRVVGGAHGSKADGEQDDDTEDQGRSGLKQG